MFIKKQENNYRLGFSWLFQKNYPNLKKLPEDIDDSLNELEENKILKEYFGEDVIKSYIKLKRMELKDFYLHENFNKTDPITDWEKNNTLDC